MADAITIKALQDASLDAKSLEDVVNGDEDKQVTTRLGETYPSVKKAITQMFENGGLPASPFDSQAAMESSNLGDGEYAIVTNDANKLLNGLYYKSNGVWQSTSLREAVARTDRLVDINWDLVRRQATLKDDVVFAFEDSEGKVGVTINAAADISANNIVASNNMDYPWAVVGEDGFSPLALDKDGNLISPTITDIYSKLEALSINRIAGVEFYKSDLMHIFNYGQSLTFGGSSAAPALTTTQPFSNLTFKSGTLKRTPDTDIDYSGFIPIVEGVSADYESPTSSITNNFVKFMQEQGDNPNKWVMLGNATGRGSTTIEQLAKGSVPYDATLEQIEAAKALAEQRNDSYNVFAMTWTQGEGDYRIGTPPEAYRDKLIKLHDDFASDAMQITGQSFAPLFVTYQTAGHRWHERDNLHVSMGQWLASQQSAIILSTPIYHLRTGTDGLHLTNKSSYLLGAYHAKALAETVANNKKFEPLMPVNIHKTGRVIEVTFNKKGLALDTEYIDEATNFGFDIHTVGGNLLDIISSVTVVDDNRIKIVCSNDLPVGATLSYARGRNGDEFTSYAARGNVRDSSGSEHSVSVLGETHELHNWLIHFTLTI